MLMRSRNQNLLPDVFNALFDTTCTAAAMPAVNIIERENEYSIELAAAGMKREDFHITIDPTGENLIVDMEHKVEHNDETETQDKKEHYIRHEFGYTKFHRSFILPDNIDRDAITATTTDGVLTITLPKQTPTTREAREITIG